LNAAITISNFAESEHRRERRSDRSPLHQMQEPRFIDKGAQQAVSQHPAFVFRVRKLMPHQPVTG
jgi:hypothetical protein